MIWRLVYIAASKEHLRRIHINFMLLNHHFISYFIWNFHSNRLLFLRVVQENNSVCFFLNTLYFLAWSYVIQFSIDCGKKFLNWLRTSCVVCITTVATWHSWTADFWADFEKPIIDRTKKRVAKRLWHCVTAARQHSNTCCNFWDRKTILIPTETLFV